MRLQFNILYISISAVACFTLLRFTHDFIQAPQLNDRLLSQEKELFLQGGSLEWYDTI